MDPSNLLPDPHWLRFAASLASNSLILSHRSLWTLSHCSWLWDNTFGGDSMACYVHLISFSYWLPLCSTALWEVPCLSTHKAVITCIIFLTDTASSLSIPSRLMHSHWGGCAYFYAFPSLPPSVASPHQKSSASLWLAAAGALRLLVFFTTWEEWSWTSNIASAPLGLCCWICTPVCI